MIPQFECLQCLQFFNYDNSKELFYKIEFYKIEFSLEPDK